jgi:segregation and condensation protein A
MNIKARMLLPKPVLGEDEEAEDPRTELVERLLEYKKFKEAAEDIRVYEDRRRRLYSRKYFPPIKEKQEISQEEYLENVTLFDLLLAFKKALDSMPKVTYHEVKKIEVTVEQQADFIMNKFTETKMILFSELVKNMKERIVVIVTFLALLDLMRLKRVDVKQYQVFDDIQISSLE